MTDKKQFTSDQIERAAESLMDLRSAYRAILDFYKQIFIAQENSKKDIHIDPIQISEEMLSIKADEEFPLINLSEFAIDVKASRLLLIKICNIVKETNENMAFTANTILKAIDDGEFDSDSLFFGLIKEDDSVFEETAEKYSIKKADLGFIIYNSIKPSLSLCAEQLSTHLEKNQPWSKGYCPVCGSHPSLSIFEGEGGARFLFCGFCGHKWSSKRLYCPFCDNMDSDTLGYLYSEQEGEYRIDLCEKCKKYIKTIDIRKTNRMIYPPFEQVATLHLDIKAAEMGFKSGIDPLV